VLTCWLSAALVMWCVERSSSTLSCLHAAQRGCILHCSTPPHTVLHASCTSIPSRAESDCWYQNQARAALFENIENIVTHKFECCAAEQAQLYDLRAPRGPLAVLRGHHKAVSYVRWAGADTLVTASTDSTLRVWTATQPAAAAVTAAAATEGVDAVTTTAAGGVSGAAGAGVAAKQPAVPPLPPPRREGDGVWRCSQVLSGHTNVKHFVGLAARGGLVACGSETNEVYLYHRALPRPRALCALRVPGEPPPALRSSGPTPTGSASTTSGGGGGSSRTPFVSALTWRRDGGALLAANSRGGLWLLELEGGGHGIGS
jgi:WD40 repeat protein